MSQGCSHDVGNLTLIIDGPFGSDDTEMSLAVQFCRKCGQAFTNDTLVLANMNATGKAALSGVLGQLPTGSEIFAQLFQLNAN